MSHTDDVGHLLEEINAGVGAADGAMMKRLETRGRQCIGPGILKKAEGARKGARDDGEIVRNLTKAIRLVYVEGDRFYLVCPKCYCHALRGHTGPVPAGYCECSRGFAMALFEHELGRPVDVVIESTVLRGDRECRLRVVL